jgi:hypothetical protein
MHNAPSNAAFDQSLRRQNPEWGVRDTAELRKNWCSETISPYAYELPASNAILTFEHSLG